MKVPTAILLVYTVFLLLLGYLEFRRKEGLTGFLVANRKASTLQVAFSMIATCVGGTATIGIAGNVLVKGFPAIWWLLSGALGLLVLALFLAKTVRQTQAMTLPEIAQHAIGPPARPISAVIICIAWCSILAAQFSACAHIVSAFGVSFETALPCCCLVIVLYTALGGQASVIKSDIIQYLLVIAAFAGVLLWLFFTKEQAFALVRWELVNERFSYGEIGYYLLFVGASYIIDPMLFSRLLSARDEKTALRGALWGALGIALSGLAIVLTGFGAMTFIEGDIRPDQLLTVTLFRQLPPSLGLFLLLGLLSAIISSADTCLVTASSIFAHDIVRSHHLALYRLMTLIFGLAALLLAVRGDAILSYLLAANDIFVGGVVVPLFVAMISGGRVRMRPMLAAMTAGGALGLVSALGGILNKGSLWDSKVYSVCGILLSLLLSLAARNGGSKTAD